MVRGVGGKGGAFVGGVLNVVFHFWLRFHPLLLWWKRHKSGI